MNKTVTVNIGGIVFHIDENAYERFKQYLESIRIHFTGSDGRDEIMQDIESRIAEMFQEKIKDQKQVITLGDVEEVTTVMGRPEQFGDEADDKHVDAASGDVKVKRRLFRNPDDNLLGGVCSGIAAYFDIDPVWIRLAFAIAFFFGGSGIVLYLILWIVIPKAVTTADKLQMKGEPVTVSNIEKNVQEELEHFKKKSSPEGRKTASGVFTSIIEGIGQIIKFIFIFLGKLIAVVFLLIGLIFGIVMFATLLAAIKVPGTTYPEIINQIFPTGFQFGIAFVAAMFVVGIPLLLVAYYGARVLFNIRKSSRMVNLGALGLWIVAFLVCCILGYTIAKDFSEKQSIRKEIELIQPSAKSIVLKLDRKIVGEKDYDRWDDDEWNGDLRLDNDKMELQSKDIRLDVVESKSDSFELVQVCYARGGSKKIAAEHATHISYAFNQQDSIITFDPHFVIEKNEKYRAQRMQLILKVPVGKKVYLDKTLRNFIYDIKNVNNIWDDDMLGHWWIMKEDGLNCIDCDGTESSLDENFRLPGHPHNPIHPGRVRINSNGVYIEGDNDEFVSIDSNGVVIRQNGKIKTIKKGNVRISIDDEWEAE